MSFNAYIVIDLDDGRRCWTTGDPETREFDGETFVFIPGVQDVTLPPNVMELHQKGDAKGGASVTFFDDRLTPGTLLAQYTRIQGRPMRVWVVDSAGYTTKVFDGETDSVDHNLAGRSIKINGGPVQSNVDIPFPPNTTLEDGRLVARVQAHVMVTESKDAYFDWLRDLVYFTTPWGSPDDAVDSAALKVLFYPTEIPKLSGTWNGGSLTDPEGKTYLWWEGSAADEAVPVIYGNARNLSLAPFAHYRAKVDVFTGGAWVSTYYKIYIYPIACHHIIGDDRLAPAGGVLKEAPDFMLALRWGDDLMSDTEYGAPANTVSGAMPGYLMSDRLNGALAYVTLPVPYQTDQFEEVIVSHRWEVFDPGNVYAILCRGKADTGKGIVSGLGNVLRDAWMTFGSATAEAVDWEIVEAQSCRLNAYQADFVFNSRQRRQTLRRILNSRISETFPVTFGNPRGRFAWTCTALPIGHDPIRHIEYGRELLERTAIKETAKSRIRNSVSVSYAMDGKRSGAAFTATVDSSSSDTCRASVDRWGPSKVTKLQAVDTQSAVTANKIATEFVTLNAGIRIDLTYTSADLTLTRIPLLSVIALTDDEAGFSDEPFYYLGHEWSSDMMTISIRLLSATWV
jgi:hypothetical protein